MRSVPRFLVTMTMAALATTAGCHQVDPSSPARSRAPGIGAKVGRRQNADVQIAMGRTAESGGDLETATAAYTEALKNDPHRADGYQRLAVVHDRLGEFKESATYYSKALAMSPGDAEIFCDKGYSLYLQRRWAEADICLRQAIALKPRLARAHNNLGLLLAKDGKVDEALAEFRAAGLQPFETHQNVAFVMSTERRWDEARRQYELAIAANPGSTVARERLAELAKVSDKLQAQTPEPRRDTEVMTASATSERGGDAATRRTQKRPWPWGRSSASNGSISAKDRANEAIDSPR